MEASSLINNLATVITKDQKNKIINTSTDEQFKKPIISVDLESGKANGRGIKSIWEGERTQSIKAEDGDDVAKKEKGITKEKFLDALQRFKTKKEAQDFFDISPGTFYYYMHKYAPELINSKNKNREENTVKNTLDETKGDVIMGCVNAQGSNVVGSMDGVDDMNSMHSMNGADTAESMPANPVHEDKKESETLTVPEAIDFKKELADDMKSLDCLINYSTKNPNAINSRISELLVSNKNYCEKQVAAIDMELGKLTITI